MSAWASIDKGGEPLSAWEYRAIFLKFGKQYDTFFCPFCDVKLAAALIYKEGEISKSPHFSARWGDHIYDCDGEPISLISKKRRPAQAHYEVRDMRFPEAFTTRPPPRKKHDASIDDGLPAPTSLGVLARRKSATSLGKALPKTYLLQPIVEAHKSVLDEIFKKAKIEGWNTSDTSAVLKQNLSKMPLHLKDATNYDDGFRTPLFTNRIHPRIYKAMGKVGATRNQFIIASNVSSKDGLKQVMFSITIDRIIETETLPQSHRALLETLARLAANNSDAYWHAYGLPSPANGELLLKLESLDYLYIKK